MRIHVIAPFEIPGLDGEDCLEVEPGTRVSDVLARAAAARRFAGLLPVAVNGRQVDGAHVLADGDILVVVFPTSGG